MTERANLIGHPRPPKPDSSGILIRSAVIGVLGLGGLALAYGVMTTPSAPLGEEPAQVQAYAPDQYASTEPQTATDADDDLSVEPQAVEPSPQVAEAAPASRAIPRRAPWLQAEPTPAPPVVVAPPPVIEPVPVVPLPSTPAPLPAPPPQ